MSAFVVILYLVARRSLWRVAEKTFGLKGLSHVLLSSIFGSAGTLLLLTAVSLGDASQVYPLGAIETVVVLLLAWIFLKERPDWRRVLGIAIIALGIVLVAL